MMLVFSKVNHKRSIRVRRTREPGFDTDSDSVRNVGDKFFISIISVTLHCANGLIACDSFGKSDPYCYVDLGNQRFRSRTIYKTVNPGMTSKISHLKAFLIG